MNIINPGKGRDHIPTAVAGCGCCHASIEFNGLDGWIAGHGSRFLRCPQCGCIIGPVPSLPYPAHLRPRGRLRRIWDAVTSTTDRERGASTSGIELIAAERQRQIDAEGWSPEHDDGHTNGEMAFSAAAYALWDTDKRVAVNTLEHRGSCFPLKPGGQIRNLVRAGALVAAEIDRLQRRDPAS
jgi:hypothetical protein